MWRGLKFAGIKKLSHKTIDARSSLFFRSVGITAEYWRSQQVDDFLGVTALRESLMENAC